MNQDPPSETSKSAVEFQNVSCHFGAVIAVNQVDFSIREGEFFSMLGPSGSGKTTCLRMIAGFESPTAGVVRIHGKDAGKLPPYERDVNTVFQDYALFPHMSVGQNVEYGLMIRNVSKSDRKKQALEMLDMIQLPDVYDRKPSQLSGGQRQRVALARALINKPRVLLLDEPLGALDLKLREQMQVELKLLQRKVGITFVFVTHDQEEALTMSDRIAVFKDGKVEQIGTPFEIYEKPKTSFVASFVGFSNIFEGKISQEIFGDTNTYLVRPEKIRVIPNASVITKDSLDPANGPSLSSKDYSVSSADPSSISIKARVTLVIYSGSHTKVEFTTQSGQKILASLVNSEYMIQSLSRGKEVMLTWKQADSQVIVG